MNGVELVERPRAVDPLRQAAALVWPNLPVLLAGSAVVVGTAAVVKVLAPLSAILAIVAAGLLVLPALAALVRGAQVMLQDEVFGLVDLLRALARSFRPTAALAAPAVVALCLADVAATQWIVHRQSWMMISLGLCLAVSGIVMVLVVIAVPYRLRADTRWVDCWRVAAYVTSRHPVPVLAVVSVFLLLGWAVGHASLAVLIIVPGPLALLWAVAAGSATAECHHRLHLART